MPRDLYDCTAGELATSPVEHLSNDTAPRGASTWLAENGYDAAPVYRDGDPVGFVHEDDVTANATGTLEDCLTPLTITHMISGDAAFPAVLDALTEHSAYFLGGHNHVSGVLTRADLNTAPARIYLFDRITYLEEHLRELVLAEAPDWKRTSVSVGELDAIEERYEDARAANVALSEIHYAQFSTLETIVTDVEACWRACGFAQMGTADSRLHAVTELRNDVAHANLLVENTDSDDFLSSGRTTENLRETLDTVTRILASLRDAGYDPDSSGDPSRSPNEPGTET